MGENLTPFLRPCCNFWEVVSDSNKNYTIRIAMNDNPFLETYKNSKT